MTIEDQITELLDQAEPLRSLPDDEAEAKGLPRIVDKINALRAKQMANCDATLSRPVTFEGADVPMPDDSLPVVVSVKRGPGRPPKARVEGDDA